MVQESLALFDCAGVNAAATAMHLITSNEADAAATTQPTVGQQMAKVFDAYKHALDAYIKAVGHAAQLERSALPDEEYMLAVRVHNEHKHFELVSKVATRIRDRMIRIAERRFAPVGGSLDIDSHAVDQHCPIERRDRHGNRCDDRKVLFNPVACWEYLEKTHGGAAGEAVAFRQTAQVIKSEMFSRDDMAVVVRAGRAVVTVRMWTQKNFRGQNEISYHCGERIGKLFHALSTFASWADFTDLMAGCHDARRHWGYSTPVTSRERFDLGDHCHYVTFHEKWEIHLSQNVAERLQIFLGQFGSDE